MKLIPLIIIIPLAGAFITPLLYRWRRTAEYVTTLLVLAVVLITARYLFFLQQAPGTIVYTMGGWLPPQGISLVFDGLSGMLLLIVNSVALLISIYAAAYMERFSAKYRFFTLFLLIIGGMNGVILSGDIFNLFVFLEIASLAGYTLIAHRADGKSLEAAFKYIILGSIASLLILLAITFLYSYTSTLNMADMAEVLSGQGTTKIVAFVSVLLLVGFSIKGAIVPFHAWMPDAYSVSPATIPAISTLMVKGLGIYSIIRIFSNVFPHNPRLSSALLFLGAISLLIGGLLALVQKTYRRVLGYSSVSQIGYIILALGVGTPLAITGALFHILNHCLVKPLLFLGAGAVEYATDDDTLSLDEARGLSSRIPTTSTTSLIGACALSGIPPFCGFFSKLLIIFACIQSGYAGYAFIAIIGSIITLSYITRAQKNIFFGALAQRYNQVKAIPLSMKLPLIVLALLCLASSVLILPAAGNFIFKGARDTIIHGNAYKDINPVTHEK